MVPVTVIPPYVSACLLLVALAASGCFADRARPALPRLPARAMEAWMETGGLRVAAQPYADAEQQRQLFQRELGRRDGLLPIFVVMENVGTEPLLLRRRWILYAPESGKPLRASHSEDTVASALGDEGLDWERAIGRPERLSQGRFDLGLSYLFGDALPSRVDAMHYASWQVPTETTLVPGGRIRGFVYFEDRKASSPPTVGTLTVRFRKAKGSPHARPSRAAVLPLGAHRPRTEP